MISYFFVTAVFYNSSAVIFSNNVLIAKTLRKKPNFHLRLKDLDLRGVVRSILDMTTSHFLQSLCN